MEIRSGEQGSSLIHVMGLICTRREKGNESEREMENRTRQTKEGR